jgi:hypothetical protein
VVGGQELAPEWRVWVLENLLRSGSTADITRLLVERGVDRRMATKAVAQLRRSPELAVCAHLLASAGRAEQVVELLLRHRRALEHVPRRPTPGAEVFYDEIFAQQRPMIFPDLVPGWPAFGKWTPAYLREQFGHVEVEVTSGRDADAAYDQNGSKNAIRCLLSAFVDRVTRVEESNDFYMVAQGRNLGRPELAGLFDDVTLPAGWFDEALLNTSSALWFGPKGTVTPLHHDTSSILFCQVYGSKRLQLISPLELSMYGVACTAVPTPKRVIPSQQMCRCWTSRLPPVMRSSSPPATGTKCARSTSASAWHSTVSDGPIRSTGSVPASCARAGRVESRLPRRGRSEPISRFVSHVAGGERFPHFAVGLKHSVSRRQASSQTGAAVGDLGGIGAANPDYTRELDCLTL